MAETVPTAATASGSPRAKVRMKTKLAFGVGASAEAAAHIGFISFNMLYYANVLGVPGTLVGMATLIALVFDAVSDPLMGSISDRFRSSLGRRHPFIYASALPLGLTFYAIYSPPAGLGNMGLFAWLCIFTILMRQSLTLFHGPHLALGAELSQDYQERSVVMAYAVLFQVVGGAGAAYLAWAWLARAEGGAAEASNFPPIGLAIGCAAVVIVLTSAYFTSDQIPRMSKVPDNLPRLTLRTFMAEIGACLKNRNYRMLLIGLLCISAMFGVREVLNTHMNLFFWELTAKKIKVFHVFTPLAYLLAFIITPRLHRWIDKRATTVLAVAGNAFAAATPILARMLGVFPENGDPRLFPLLIFFFAFFYFCLAMLTISVMSALGDVADEHELATGRRQEGIFYSARTFFQKVSIALGTFLAGIALDLIAFPANAKPGDIGETQVFSLGLVDGPIACLPAMLAIFFYAQYRIDKRSHAEMQATLAARRAAAAAHSTPSATPVADASPRTAAE